LTTTFTVCGSKNWPCPL